MRFGEFFTTIIIFIFIIGMVHIHGRGNGAGAVGGLAVVEDHAATAFVARDHVLAVRLTTKLDIGDDIIYFLGFETMSKGTRINHIHGADKG